MDLDEMGVIYDGTEQWHVGKYPKYMCLKQVVHN